MATYLFTWNPARWNWKTLDADVEKVSLGEQLEDGWNTGNRRELEPYSRFFVLRQGQQGHRGIIGSGYTTTPPEERPHFMVKGKTAFYVGIVFDQLVRPEDCLPRASLSTPPLNMVNWRTQSSGIVIPPKAATVLSQLWANHLGKVLIADGDAELNALEGEPRYQLVRHRRRERFLRNAKIADIQKREGRLACEVPSCGFDFVEVYGEIGKDYAQVHHRKPLGNRDAPELTKLSDLAIVCANCHAMIHRGGKCRPLEGLMPGK